ncbi:MAG TPA: hypothetical protein VFN26_11565 [Candidatus Acidoferrum sp.]|nr:hypothetical protein [Candidatus Acidoferrum sp.]
MAGEVAPPPVTISPTDSLYRGINPQFYENGQVTSGVFCLKKKDTLEDAPSVGIEKLVPLQKFHSFMGAGWGVGQFSVSVPLGLGLTVHLLPEPSWKEYADAHAVITGYQALSNSKRGECERALRDAVRQNVRIPPSAATAPIPPPTTK